MILLLVAGIVFLLAGAASIIVGVPVKEFSFGNTLILSGVIGFCTGALLLGLSAVIRELRSIGSGLGTEDIETDVTRAPGRTAFPQPTAAGADSDALFPGDRSEPSAPPQPLSPAAEPAGVMPWQDEAAARDRLRQRAAAPLEIKPPPPPVSAPRDTLSSEPEDEQTPPKRRNLLFASSRRERERAALAGSEAPAGDLLGGGAGRDFEDAWPRKRSAAGGDETPAAPERSGLLEPTPAPRSEEMQQVTVLKSGVVDGMAYSLYSDGSIEAQMPEGMMRFESIDELREHLEQRS
ncbi:DUF2892 domain-containing protein [Rhodopseudomonas palustris]|uniref:DUF2892 domain-containing protein n=1 Tax=Rhodopseudomonas palustris TaxID=1076 RepID=UPI000E5BF9CD|nr:DUF2892 domain-containing protein [Rhodopseudomonas palustris]QLH70932.1 hypothetical protein HZF03_09130 [Rhodopseudomonas palustris]RIA02057.1 hypothetical protein D1920_10300 [Rhodopseudomonas palustris]